MKTAAHLRFSRSARGFTLIEVLVALAVGTIITLAAFKMYRDAVSVTTLISQRTNTQDNARAALNAISRDLNMAGGGLPLSGVAVADNALYGCADTSKGCLTTFTFPVNDKGTHTLYGAIPHYQEGATVNGVATDAITIVYVDSSADSYRDGCADCGYDIPGALVSATFSAGLTTLTFKAGVDPPLNDPRYGFHIGDVVLLSNQNGQAVGYISSMTDTVLTLNSGDPLKMNVASGNGSIANLQTCTEGEGCILPPETRAHKLTVITYYVQVNPLAYLPQRLMRQVNGFDPVPVAEQIESLKITYDIYDPNKTYPIQAGLTDPVDLNVIKKVNLTVISQSEEKNWLMGKAKQRKQMTTSVAPRNLSFFNSYQ